MKVCAEKCRECEKACNEMVASMKAKTALTLHKAYRQEGPLDWGLLSFPEPRREDP